MEKHWEDPDIGLVVLKKNPASRRMSIRVHPVNGVSVILPRTFSYEEGLRFYALKRSWVLDTVRKQRLKSASAEMEGRAVPRLQDGSVVKTLMSEIVFRRAAGEKFPVSGTAPSVRMDIETLEEVQKTGRTCLSLDKPLFRKVFSYSGRLPEEGSVELDALLRKLLVEELRKEARIILPRKVDFFCSRFGFKVNGVAVKHNSSNWGSCSSRGNINLNLNLVRIPEPLCDLVVLHELSHLRHADHGAGFHDLLEKLAVDNVARLAMTGDPYLPFIVRRINASRSAQPVHRTMEAELKKYRLV